ncbi:hypothetical protein ACQB60_30885 [Actinomycetota bacterium Odt1-20B]
MRTAAGTGENGHRDLAAGTDSTVIGTHDLTATYVHENSEYAS